MTAVQLLTLSERIDSPEQLRRFAVKGLGLELHEVDAPLANFKGHVGNATYEVLKKWHTSQQNNVAAKVNLEKALEVAGMPLLKKEIE